MKGSYKVYNANKGEWVNLDTSAGYDNVKVKIENDKLYVSYDYGTENSWEYVGEVGDTIKLKIENNHLWSSYDGEKTWEDIGEVGANIEPTYVCCTYKDLVGLRDSSKLIPGTFYRITDYECITIKEGTQSAGHQFDIIVLALDNKTLSEVASAIQHEGDTYFAENNLNAWKLHYSLDNSTTKFEWSGEDDKEQLQSWITSWGVLDSNKGGASINYKTAMVDGVEKYLYAPANRGSYLNGKNFYRVLGNKVITSHNELDYRSEYAPYENEGDIDWSDVYEIQVLTKDGQRIDDLVNVGDGQFFNYDDYDSGDWMYPVYFNSSPRYNEDDGYYYYTPSEGIEDLWEGIYDGEYSIEEKEYYNGSIDSLYYAFDAPLTKDYRPAPQVYSSETKAIYKSEEWWDSVRYTAYKAPTYVGKGVIYRMVDEWGNDCPYDFKNILTENGGKYYYTFSQVGSTTIVDRTVGGSNNMTHNNVFTPYIYNRQNKLSGCIFKSTSGSVIRNNRFAELCKNIIFGDNCSDNTFGRVCQDITLGAHISYNEFGNRCSNITIVESDSASADSIEYVQHNRFAPFTKNVRIYCSDTASSSLQVQNYEIDTSVSGTTSSVIAIELARGNTATHKVMKNSSGTIKIFNEADKA